MFIVASSQYIEQIIESLAVVIHENSQKIATEVSKNSNKSWCKIKFNFKDKEENFGINRIEKMFIIEFVVKIIINESDISITKKREYMMLMLRSLLSMFNLFEEGVTHSEKNSFVKLLDMITQLLLFLKVEFKQNTDEFLKIWTKKGLFVNKQNELELSDMVIKKLKETIDIAHEEQKTKDFLEKVREMIDNNDSEKNKKIIKMQTRVICESEFGLQKLNQKRKSILPSQGLFGTELETIITDQFIAQETFQNECKVIMNLILNNCHSSIVLNNFQKLLYVLLKMEEMTVFGVLTSFRMQNILNLTKKKSMTKIFGKTSRPQKSRITRFTDLTIPDYSESTLFNEKTVYKEQDIIPERKEDDLTSQIMFKKTIPEVNETSSLDSFTKRGFPNWLLSCLEIIRQSQVEPLVFKVLEFLYSMLDWEKSSTFMLSVRYNNMLYKDKRNYSSEGIFFIILTKLFNLMEVSAYNKVALDYFMSFVMENCEFVIKFIKKKLANCTARDFRQIASLWKNTSQMNSSTVRKLLGETVFDMLNYANREDPLVRNYFKNWLQYSQKNFYLIVNKLLKKLYLHTNMKLQRGVIVYNYLYRSESFNHQLRLLKAVFTNGGNSFINFIRKTKISEEFEVYDTNMNSILENFYKNPSKKYYSFILKLLLCYLLSKPNRDLHSQFLPETSS